MLTMTKDDYEKILAHCKEGLPNEASGIRFQSKLSDLVFDGSRKSGTQCVCH